MSKAPATAKRLLSIDGGGVKGCSSVMILDAILAKTREIERKPYRPLEHRAYDYFDLAGGTSTGGLAALMMFRLKLSTKETAEKYDEMAKKIFSPKLLGIDIQAKFGKLGYWLGNAILKFKAISYPSRFPPEQLEEAIVEVAGNRNMSLLAPENPKMLMCSTLADVGETILFRSYDPPADGYPVSTAARGAWFSRISILEACRATSAAPTYFPPMDIEVNTAAQGLPEKLKTFTFWDGGVLNNNPIDQVWDARFDLAANTSDTPVVSCVLSVGTSFADTKPNIGGWRLQNLIYTVTQLMSFVTNTEARHQDFERNIHRMNQRLPEDQRTKYFRFNVPTGNEEFPMDDWQKMPKLKQMTRDYLAKPEVRKKIEECAQVLAGVPVASHVPLSEP